ncbi:unnamed protein product [Paramecium primaurelia]|uniref:Transmembrane protein n=1 Tax=Paramecium primaurelia TaxID=5886 RepID=A0A8S1QS19_PARPR|nr:unnamed protein product [Paramecium primaurelia]
MKILIILSRFVFGLIFYDTNIFKVSMTILILFLLANLIQQLVKQSFQIPFLKLKKQFQPLKKLICDFHLKISCPNQRVYALRVKWYAVCGRSYQVINYISTTSIDNMTFPHTLSNATNGFISELTRRFLLKSIQQILHSKIQIKLVIKLSQLKIIQLIQDYKVLLGNILVSKSKYNLNQGSFLIFKVLTIIPQITSGSTQHIHLYQ